MLEQTSAWSMGVFALCQAILLLALTPLFTGISRQIRARMHSRRGHRHLAGLPRLTKTAEAPRRSRQRHPG